MSLTSKTAPIFACVVVALCLSLGCSEAKDPAGSVEGTITLDGKGYSDCRAGIFCAQSSLSLGCRIDSEGVFKIQDVPPGNYVVFVYPIPHENKGKGPDPPDTSPIPKKLRKQNTSDITVDVVADEVSKVDVDLSK